MTGLAGKPARNQVADAILIEGSFRDLAADVGVGGSASIRDGMVRGAFPRIVAGRVGVNSRVTSAGGVGHANFQRPTKKVGEPRHEESRLCRRGDSCCHATASVVAPGSVHHFPQPAAVRTCSSAFRSRPGHRVSEGRTRANEVVDFPGSAQSRWRVAVEPFDSLRSLRVKSTVQPFDSAHALLRVKP